MQAVRSAVAVPGLAAQPLAPVSATVPSSAHVSRPTEDAPGPASGGGSIHGGEAPQPSVAQPAAAARSSAADLYQAKLQAQKKEESAARARERAKLAAEKVSV
jgi:hypothetical protein